MTREFPHGRLDRIYLHWSAGDYTTTYPAYHFCIVWDGETAAIVPTHDLRANMRDVYFNDEHPYAAHTYRRNAYSAGLAVMGMLGATPSDFGEFPLLDECVNAICECAATIAVRYDIPIDSDHIMTHAEAAIRDGYFGTAEAERWDMGRLHQSPAPFSADEAIRVGNELRARIASVAADVAR